MLLAHAPRVNISCVMHAQSRIQIVYIAGNFCWSTFSYELPNSKYLYNSE